MRNSWIAALPVLLFTLASCQPEPVEWLDVDYSNWIRLNSAPITETIPGHGAGVRNIFLNKAGTTVEVNDVESRKTWDYPDGTIILKTISTAAAPEQITMILGMIKAPDNRRGQGGWLWVSRDPGTGMETVFDSEFCVSCHADANERRTVADMVPTGMPNPTREFRDFVFYPYYPGEGTIDQ